MAGMADNAGQVARVRVAAGDGGVAGEHEHADGLAKNRAAAYGHRALAGQPDFVRIEQAHDAAWGARDESTESEGQRGKGTHRDAVDVLVDERAARAAIIRPALTDALVPRA